MNSDHRHNEGDGHRSGAGSSVLILGIDTFPLGLAGIQKLILIGRGLVEDGCRVTVINRWWCTEKSFGDIQVSVHGHYRGIEYYFASGYSFRPESWYRRKLLRLTGAFREASMILRVAKLQHTGSMIISTGNFRDVVYYRLLSWMLSVPLVLTVVESAEGLNLGAGRLRRLWARWVDRSLYRWIDGVLPISEYLLNQARSNAPSLPVLKVPVLVDEHRYDNLTRKDGTRYLLFCGALGYFEIIRFILNAFAETDPSTETFLYLVLNDGRSRENDLDRILAEHPRRDRIRIFSKLTDEALSQLYCDAYALLIPLRPTIKDIARFPHKVGEYCASGRPIVSTAVGEVPVYFTNWKNAAVAPSYDVREYAAVIDRLLHDPALADEIGRNGKVLAKREFDYKRYGRLIREFLELLAVPRTTGGTKLQRSITARQPDDRNTHRS